MAPAVAVWGAAGGRGNLRYVFVLESAPILPNAALQRSRPRLREDQRGSPFVPGEEDLSQLRERLSRAVSAVCPTWMADRKDDLIQVSLLRLTQIAERNEGEAQFSASYLRRVAYSALVDEIRRYRRRQEVPLEEEGEEPRQLVSPSPQPDRRMASRQAAEGIHDCLQTLLEDRRRSVALYLQGHSVPQTAELLGWEAKRTENLVYRGLVELRQCLKSKGLKP